MDGSGLFAYRVVNCIVVHGFSGRVRLPKRWIDNIEKISKRHHISPPWKSQIAHLDMHHLVFGINFKIHSISLTSLVSIHLLMISSTYCLCHHPRSHHPSLLHSFTTGSKPTFSPNPSHLHRLLLPTGLSLPHDNGTGPDLSRSSFYFYFHILIFCLFRVVD